MTIGLGENLTGYDFTLERDGSISGMVTEQGTTLGIEGLEVSACEFVNDDPCWSGWTEANGSYLISGIPPGTYRLATGWEDPWVVESYYEQPKYFDGDPVVVNEIHPAADDAIDQDAPNRG